MNEAINIPGYTHGTAAVARSPVTPADFELMKKSVLFGNEDVTYLRLSHDVLKDEVEAILDVWYGFVGSLGQLVETFAGADGAPDAAYLGAVRGRFGRWIEDLCVRDWDQAWLDQQHEIALRHTRLKKNSTDGVHSASVEVPMRYLITLIVPISVTVEPFLRAAAAADDDVPAMMAAWFKAVTLTVALWTEPYAAGW